MFPASGNTSRGETGSAENSTGRNPGGRGADNSSPPLGRVDNHASQIMAEAKCRKARKLRAVFS